MTDRGRWPEEFADEAMMLSFVEGTMEAEEAARFESRLAADDAGMLARLKKMRVDREELASVAEVRAPARLMEGVLAVIERSALLAEAPAAPELHLSRRRISGGWQRMAIAAGFVLLLGGAVVLILQTISYTQNDAGFGDSIATKSDGEEGGGATGANAGVDAVAGDSGRGGEGGAGTKLADGAVGVGDAGQGRGSIPNDATRLAANRAMSSTGEMTKSSASAAGFKPARSVGVSVNIASGDANLTLALLDQALRGAGGGVIVNLSREGVASAEIVNPVEGVRIGSNAGPPDGDSRRGGAGANPAGPGPVANEWGSSETNRLVSVEDQLAEREAGFEYSLIGKPTDLKKVLAAIAKRDDHRLEWAVDAGAVAELDRLAKPEAPRGRQMTRAMTWWEEPAEWWWLGRQAIEARGSEPMVRVGLHLVEKKGLARPEAVGDEGRDGRKSNEGG